MDDANFSFERYINIMRLMPKKMILRESIQKLKARIRNVFIIVLYLTGIPYLRFLRLRKKYGVRLVRAIVFHEIKDKEVRNFENKLRFLKKNFNIISPKQFYNREFSKEKLNVLLTFDDGYESWLRNVIPSLKEENLSAIFFVPSGFIEAGESNRDFYVSKRFRLTTEKKPLSWQNVIDLDRQGLEIGGHTINHLNLKNLDKQKLLQEIKQDKDKIEEILGHKIISFAYPFGDIQRMSKEAISAAKEAGYQVAFSTLPGFNCYSTNRFLSHRDSLNPSMPLILFRAWIYGSYDFIRGLLNIFKQAKIR